MKTTFVIEHLEPEVGRWLLYEYMHASEIAGKDHLIFTNIKRKSDALKLSKFGLVHERSATEIFNSEKTIILDPKAEQPLKTEDFEDKEATIIGGILGDHPPKNRTLKLLTSRLPKASARKLGKGQFTIDGAVYMAKLVSQGTPLEKIPVKKGLTIKVNQNHTIHLPYAYPIKDGKPLISNKLLTHLLELKPRGI